MSRIDIVELESLLAVSSRMRDAQVKELMELKTYLNEFLSEQQLKGRAIESTKRYYETGYIPLIQTTSHLLDLFIEKLSDYIQHFYEEVDHTGGRIDSGVLIDLGNRIERYEKDVENLKQRMRIMNEAGRTFTFENLENSVLSMYKEKDILNKYLAFEERHRTFFSEIESISFNIRNGLKELAEKVSFSDIHHGYNLSGLSKQWQEFIQKKNTAEDKREKNGGKQQKS